MPCPKSIILKTIDLEKVIEKAENIYNFYLDSNWEFQFIAHFGVRYILFVKGADLEYICSVNSANNEKIFPFIPIVHAPIVRFCTTGD